MKAAGFTHDNADNKSVDWYTPPWVFERLGLQFDLDPCQPLAGLPWIPAMLTYTEADDGLASPWFGRVWLNPPHGKHTTAWLAKMHQHRNGVALVFARTDCAWYHDSAAKADAILFLQGGSMLIAWGGENVAALEAMCDLGHFVRLLKE